MGEAGFEPAVCKFYVYSVAPSTTRPFTRVRNNNDACDKSAKIDSKIGRIDQ